MKKLGKVGKRKPASGADLKRVPVKGQFA